MNNKCTYCFGNKITYIPDGYSASDLEYCPVCNVQEDQSFNTVYETNVNDSMNWCNQCMTLGCINTEKH